MSDIELHADHSLTSYQKEFVHRFLSEAEPGSMHILCAPPGTGKSFAIAGAISELVRTGRFQRVLLLAPEETTVRWGYLLSRWGQEAVVVDSRSSRVLRAQLGSKPDNWPAGLYVLPIDLAGRSDVSELLNHATWDLIGVDDFDLLSDEQVQFVNRLAAIKNSPCLLSVTRVHDNIEKFAAKARVIDWRAALARLHDSDRPPLVQETRTYRRFDDEVSIIKDVIETAKQLGQPKGMVLLQRSASSISSLEETLLRWVEKQGQGHDVQGKLEHLLQRIEQLHGDSRLECFRGLVKELIVSGVGHVLVLCEYRATLDYLAAAIEGLGIATYLLHAGTPSDQFSEITERFQSEGGLLMMTAAAADGLSLGFVEAAIHYDLPLSPLAFAQREGRYHRYGRSAPCTVYYFYDETNSHPLEDLVLRIVRKINILKDNLDVDLNQIFDDVVKGT